MNVFERRVGDLNIQDRHKRAD
ncbi:hypothetical protein MED222_04920 [Vibrio sp. MED222]|nr:hypothetical protein MED222_04920 [Vibrio sp. MED222]